MARLKDYLNDETLRRVQDAFSALAECPLRVHNPEGQLALDAGEDHEEIWRESLDLANEASLSDEMISGSGQSLAVPIVLDGETLGSVRLPVAAGKTGKKHREYYQDLLRLMAGVLARLCNDAIELRGRIEQLMALHRVTAEITEGREVSQILKTATRVVAEALKAKASAVRLLDKDKAELVIKAGFGLSEKYLKKGAVKLTRSPIDREVIQTGKTVYVEDMRTDPRVLYPKDARREGIVSGLCAPMVYRDRTVGVMRIYSGENQEFDWFQTQLLQTVANATAAAIVHARLYDQAVELFQARREISMASEVQRRMIPQEPPEIEGFDLGAAYVPSRQLGGDFFDFLDLPARNLGIAICDVVGKGVRASLLMASIRASLHAHAVHVYDMAEILNLVNRSVCADTLSSDFATLFYGVLDTATRQFTCCCAGHLPPVVVRDGKVVDLITSRGGVVGVEPDMTFPVDSVTLQPGDTLLMYTDGLSESVNFAHEPYGRQRIEQALQYAVTQDYSAQGIVRHILWDFRRHCALHSRQDDVTLVVLKTSK